MAPPGELRVKAGVVCWQAKLCDPHLSALEVRFSRRGAIQIDHLYLLSVARCFVDVHFTGSSQLIILCVVDLEDPRVRGLAAQSTLTMNQELEGHKGTRCFSYHFRLLLLV